MKIDEQFRHWGYGSNFEQTTTKSEGNTLTLSNLEKASKGAKMENKTIKGKRRFKDSWITGRLFWLRRTEDVSGVSGIGVVADGVIFPGGITVLRWRTAGGSTGVYESIESLEKIHGHDGKTKIQYVPINYEN